MNGQSCLIEDTKGYTGKRQAYGEVLMEGYKETEKRRVAPENPSRGEGPMPPDSSTRGRGGLGGLHARGLGSPHPGGPVSLTHVA